MSSAVVRLTAAVTGLPPAQRAVVLPLFAWALLQQAPEGAPPAPEPVLALIDAFFASLGPDQSRWGQLIEERLKAVGVSGATFRALTLEAGSGAELSRLGLFSRAAGERPGAPPAVPPQAVGRRAHQATRKASSGAIATAGGFIPPTTEASS